MKNSDPSLMGFPKKIKFSKVYSRGTQKQINKKLKTGLSTFFHNFGRVQKIHSSLQSLSRHSEEKIFVVKSAK